MQGCSRGIFNTIFLSKIIFKRIRSGYLYRYQFLQRRQLQYSLNHKNIQSSLQIFNRETKFLQRERAASSVDIKTYDYLKDEVGSRLADRIFDIKRVFDTALDLGCGRGHISKNIVGKSVKRLVLTEMSPSWLNQAYTPKDIEVSKQNLDEENFIFEPNSLDLIVSSLSLHWVNDLPKCFNNIMNSLKNDGVFIGAVFGADTLYELRGALQLAELEREGGISPHVSPFTRIRDIGGLLNNAGFTMLTIDTDELIIGYPSIFDLMADLKGMAENNAVINRKLHIKRQTLLASSAIYNELYGKKRDDGSPYIPATFQIIYMIGWKPDKSQPKPSLRGSGNISLKDIDKLDEVIRKSGPSTDGKKKV